jgi:hypothetical protein
MLRLIRTLAADDETKEKRAGETPALQIADNSDLLMR